MTPTETAVPDINMTDGCTTDHFVYGDGDLGSTVELYRVNGGGHTWPGSPTFITIGVTSQDFSASVEIWRFFRQYKLNDLNTGIKEGEKKGSVQVYPNPSNGSVSIRFETSGLRTIELHDPMGRKLTSVRSTGTQHQLEIEGSGLFLLSVIAEQGIHTERLIIN
jgi:polyhydroxybutyrate depolymerase